MAGEKGMRAKLAPDNAKRGRAHGTELVAGLRYRRTVSGIVATVRKVA